MDYRDERIAPYELDIYLPRYRLAIEYDGTYGHFSGKEIARDIRKNSKCGENCISLIRIRENSCPEFEASSFDYRMKDRNGLKEATYFLYDYLWEN